MIPAYSFETVLKNVLKKDTTSWPTAPTQQYFAKSFLTNTYLQSNMYIILP